MDKKKGISFLVTVYNKSKFILHTLESVKKNLILNSEIVIVNDGSTDDSEKKIKKFININNQVSIKYVYQKNSGPSIATNKAISLARFSHIKLVDGDDILSPGSSEYMYTKMKELNLDLLYGDWKWDDDHFNYKFKPSRPKAYFYKNSFEKILLSGWGGSSNLMVSTKAIKKTGGCDETIFIQDFSLPIRIAGYHLKNKNNEKFRIGITEKIICVGPKFSEDRVMNSKAQTLHDLSMATLNFLNEHDQVSHKNREKCFSKINRRIWKWKKREKKVSMLSNDFFDYLKSYLPFKTNVEKLKYEIIKTWKDQIKIYFFHKDQSKKKILIYVGLDLLGDALIKIPFLKNLKAIFPKSEITWVAGKGYSTMNSSLKPLSENLIDNFKEKLGLGEKWQELFKKSKINHEFDIIFDTQKRFLTTLILKKIKSKIFISPSANYFFSDLKPDFKDEKNLTKELINLSSLLSYKKKEIILEQKFKPGLSLKSKKYILQFNKKKVAICPGASVEWKKWPLNNFIKISDYLASKKYTPVFFLGPKEEDMYNSIKSKLPESLFPIQETNIKQYEPHMTILFARYCSFGLSNDTGCGHLLASADIPLISLFGPTNAEKFAPFNSKNLNTTLSATDFNTKNNIENIPPNEVIKIINQYLKF